MCGYHASLTSPEQRNKKSRELQIKTSLDLRGQQPVTFPSLYLFTSTFAFHLEFPPCISVFLSNAERRKIRKMEWVVKMRPLKYIAYRYITLQRHIIFPTLRLKILRFSSTSKISSYHFHFSI